MGLCGVCGLWYRLAARFDFAIRREPLRIRWGASMKPSNVRAALRKAQSGVMLLEALIAILIFSIGILGIVSLQAVSVKLAGDAKYRSEASLWADDLLSQMWASDRVPANMSANFGTGGAAYTVWLANIRAAGLPGTVLNPPIVTVDTTANTVTTGTTTITVRWLAPNDGAVHSHTIMAQIR